MPTQHQSPVVQDTLRRFESVVCLLACGLALSCGYSTQTEMKQQNTERGEIQYLHHKPVVAKAGRVMLSHGFLRNPDTMRHLAESFAKDGIETACIALHRSKPWAGNHAENARDMIALRKALGWDKVTYAGYSAGGLSALLAAAEDSACVRVLLLDPVESGALGEDAAPKVRVPVLTILGQPGPGNAHRNATAMLAALPRGKTIELADAVHCDFEARSSSLCHLFTGSKVDDSRTSAVHEELIRHSTTFLTIQQ